jgi:hypothetical protein
MLHAAVFKLRNAYFFQLLSFLPFILFEQLYEESLIENECLKDKLKKTEDDLSDSRLQIDKMIQHVSIFNSKVTTFSDF